jgi:hypothetical protein
VRIRKAAPIPGTLADSHEFYGIEVFLQLVHGEFEFSLGSVSADVQAPRIGVDARDIRKMPPNKESIVRRDGLVEEFHRRFVIRGPERPLDERLLAGQRVADRGIHGSLRELRFCPTRYQAGIGEYDATGYRA